MVWEEDCESGDEKSQYFVKFNALVEGTVPDVPWA